MRSSRILIALFLLPLAGPATAGMAILGQQTDEQLADAISDAYARLAVGGRIPLSFHTVASGEQVVSILRAQTRFKGEGFPVLLDALVCDMNPGSCKRDLRLAGFPAAGGTAIISNFFALEPTRGDWRSLKINTRLMIPNVTIDTIVVPAEYKKKAGEDIDSIIAGNEVCLKEGTLSPACGPQMEWMNYAYEGYRDRSYAGPIFVPAYEYLVSIADDCRNSCLESQTVEVDLTGDVFLSEPFKFVSEASREVNSGLIAKQLGKPDLIPPSVRMDVGEAVRSFESSLHGIIKDVKPFSNHLTEGFNQGQAALLDSIRYPAALVADAQQQLAPQSVLVIDSVFDKEHCDFSEERLIVFDCRYKVFSSGGDSCRSADALEVPEGP